MRVQDCCCLLSLRVGALAVGIFDLVTSVGAFIMYFSSQSALDMFANVTAQSALDMFTSDDAALRTSLAVAAGLLTKATMSVFLVYAVCKGKTAVLLLWLVVSGVSAIASVAGVVAGLAGVLPGPGPSAGVVLGVLVDAVLTAYFLTVVHSYRRFLVERRAGQGKA